MSVLSSKPYNAGDVVFRCKPLMFVVINELKSIHCANCLKRSLRQLKRCSKCLEMYYCGKDCQINDWKYHKNECKIFRHQNFQRSLFDEKDLLLLRLYLRVKSDPTFATQRHQLVDGSDVCLKDFKLKDFGSVQEYWDYKTTVTKVCQQFRFIGIDVDVKDLDHWFELNHQLSFSLSYNSHNILGFTQHIAASLVLEVMPIRHSCLPNTAYVTKGISKEIRAMKSISTGDEITISYISLFMNRTDRQLALRTRRIDCNYSKCRLHLDKDIDHQEILSIRDDYQIKWKCLDNPIFGPMMNVLYEMDTNYLLRLKEILGDFHPIITLFMLKSFMCLSLNSRSVAKPMLKLWYKEVERHLLVTQGSDHPWFALLTKYKPK